MAGEQAAPTQQPQSKAAAPRVSGRGSRRREQILSVAEQLFLEKGYEATSLQDIADAVGLLKGSLFYYIAEKEDLLYAILEDIYSTFLGAMDEVTKSEAEPLVKVRQISEVHVRNLLTTNRGKVTVFFKDFRSLSDSRRQQIEAERNQYARRFTALLQAGQEEGAVCPDIDVRLASGSILGMLNMVYEWYPHGDEKRVQHVAHEMGDLVIASVACAPKHHTPGHRRSAGQA